MEKSLMQTSSNLTKPENNKRTFNKVQSLESDILSDGMTRKRSKKKRSKKAKNDKVVELRSPEGEVSTCNTEEADKKISSKKKMENGVPRIDIDLEQLFSENGARPGGQYLHSKDIKDLIMFSVLGSGRWEKPTWCNLFSSKKIEHTLFLMVNYLSGKDFLEFTDTFQHITSKFNTGYTVKNDGSDGFFLSPLESFLFYKMKKKSAKKKGKSHDVKTLRPQDLILTPGQLMVNEYPVAHEMSVEEREGYVSTRNANKDYTSMGYAFGLRDDDDDDELMSVDGRVFAIDCEMCLSAGGHELTRVSVVNEDCEVLYDTFVKPKAAITDYLTQYSGITPEILANENTTLGDVQQRLLEIISQNDIIVGHSLDNDMRALKIFHSNYIDTSIIYGDQRGARFKPSLKSLVKSHLRREIQNNENGHCSIEDAKACMQLLHLKLEKGINFGIFENFKESIFEAFERAEKKCAVVDTPSIARQHCFGNTKAILCTSDDQVVNGARKSVQDSDFVFAHFKDFERLLKEHDAMGNKPESEKVKETLSNLDRNLGTVIESAPENTLIVLLFGSGFLSNHFQRLQRDKKTRPSEEVKSAIRNARDCVGFFQVKT
ncbi:uncharacterized protein LOC135692165 isoform X1 [Rhopilema esculentum]|uniref:uncharacterized protein LOC135692165 isoform X1 n=2 Tax=Rhopilema esculentum TaxID=499914 RepID=UPI0031D6601B